MANPNLSELLKSFDQNQLREINAFLNSSKGRQLKNGLSESDKKRLMQEFSKLDPAAVRKAIKGMKPDDLMRMINKL